MEQLSLHGLSVLGWLFESTIYISILIGLIFTIKTLTKKKLPAWWIYCLWLLLLVRMLVPFGVETPVSVYNYVPAPPENSSYMPYLEQYKINIPLTHYAPDTAPVSSPDVAPAEVAGAAESDKPEKPIIEQHATDTHESAAATDTSGFNLSLDKALLLFWLTGVLAFGIITVYKNCRFWLIVKREQPITDKDILDLFNECKSTLGLQKKVEIIVTDSVKSPAIFGYFKPQLLLPTRFLDTLKKEDLYCVFLHELGHVKRHDIGITWLATLLQVIYWFNPLVWLAFHHLRADQEAACDAYVLSKIKQVRPTDYARTIVNLLESFVQNRQLPSLAGIIENKSQIDRRISMILDYKRITLKKTFVSVFMLFIMIGAFLACSTDALEDKDSSDTTIVSPETPVSNLIKEFTGPDNGKPLASGMKRYVSSDGNITVDVPDHWLPSPHEKERNEIGRFSTPGSGITSILYNPSYSPWESLETSLDVILEYNKGYWEGFKKSEKIIGGKKVLLFDCNHGATSLRDYFFEEGKYKFIFAFFGNTKEGIPEELVDVYEQVMMSYTIRSEPEIITMKEYTRQDLEPPLEGDMKRYISPDGDITIDVPDHWGSAPYDESKNEIGCFATAEDGLNSVFCFYKPQYHPRKSLETRRDENIQYNNGFWKNFKKSEKIIGDRKALILDFNNGRKIARIYSMDEGGYKYDMGFIADTKDGIIPEDLLEEYDQVMKGYNIRKKPKAVPMKEYSEPDDKKPIATGMKRYISPYGNYTVDVPGDWLSSAEDNEYGRAYHFMTQKNDLAANFYPRDFTSLTLEKWCDNDVRFNTDVGFTILGNSETVINGRKVLMYDLSKDATTFRNYYFKEGNYIYSAQFYTYNTDKIPADRVEGFERVMKSINILKAN